MNTILSREANPTGPTQHKVQNFGNFRGPVLVLEPQFDYSKDILKINDCALEIWRKILGLQF
jgi:hypothetical protein